MSGLVEFIKSQVYPGLLEDYRQKYNQGGPLSFGPLILTAKGIQRKDQMLQWEDLGQVSLGRGILSLELIDGQRVRIPAHKVPNVEICTQLIEHLRARQGANDSVDK
jgi:hypothetical protein